MCDQVRLYDKELSLLLSLSLLPSLVLKNSTGVFVDGRTTVAASPLVDPSNCRSELVRVKNPVVIESK